jgi:predicted esterase
LLHGTGGDENDLIQLGRSFAPNANLLSPRGQVLENGMPRFFRRIETGVFDEEDLIRRAEQLSSFIGTAATRYALDPTRVRAIGYSNGANMAATLLLLHAPVLAGAALLRAVLPLTPYAPIKRVTSLADLLERGGAKVEVNWVNGGHGLEPEELDSVTEWIARTQPGAGK